MCLDGLDLPYVGPGTHEGKSIFGVTVEFTPATTAANFKLHYIEVAFEKKEGIFEYVCVDMGSMERVRDSRVLSGASNFKWSV